MSIPKILEDIDLSYYDSDRGEEGILIVCYNDEETENFRKEILKRYNQHESLNDIVTRLDKIIKDCQTHKQNKSLANNYHIVLREMKNLRDNIPFGD